MISDRLTLRDCIFTNIDPSIKMNLTEKNKRYLAYHRKNIFKWTILFVDSCMWIYSQYAGGFSVYVSSG